MSVDTQYQPVPYLYKSRGAIARWGLDRAPEYTYLQLLNCQERQEEEMSSRYGTVIVNRDPAGVGTNNYYFTNPVTSLSRLAFQGNAWRYAGLSDGTLWRRSGNTQGAYTQIDSGLSGNPFSTIVTNCFETSQPYLFIYDDNLSIKDNGLLAAPELTGIDPSVYPVSVIPYSPLLTLIDNFATGNSYATTGVSGWAWATVTTLSATSSQLVTDFYEFFASTGGGGGGTTYSLAGTESVTATQSGIGGNQQYSSSLSGFPSIAIGVGQTVTLSLTVSGNVTISGTGGQGGIIAQYSPDGGTTWINMFNSSIGTSMSFGPFVATVAVSVTNLSTLQVRASAAAGVAFPGGNTQTFSAISAVSATVTTASIFADVAQGMLSVLNTNSTVRVPIVNVQGGDPVDGVFSTLLVTTQVAHGFTSTGTGIAIYGCSNDQVDGFYKILSIPTTTTFKVAFQAPSAVSATGGFVMGGAATGPSTCVIANQYSNPYPSQFSAWGFYQQVPQTTSSFPIGCWQGTVAANSVGTIGTTGTFDLSINDQVNDDDLIVLVLQVSQPQNITNIRLQFDVNSSGYASSYYFKDLAPAFYQGNIANQTLAYQATQQQILADTLGLITGQPPNTTSAQLQPSNFSTGSGSWIAAYMRRGDFLPVGNASQSGVDWTQVTGWQVVVTTGTGGSSTIALNGLYLQWGYGPSSFGGVGYDYRITYYNAATGTESSPNPEQNFNEQFGYLSTQDPPIFLRQAAQILGLNSLDPQVTHIRIYRRGGSFGDNWRLIDKIPNNTSGFLSFIYKDVTSDAVISQAETLALDNDPPVTSSLVNPIDTTLSAPTVNAYGNTFYQTSSPQFLVQTVTTTNAAAVFVPGQIVDVGNPANLEQVMVVTGGTGQFTAVFQLQHNAGESVQAYSIPRAKCDLCALSNSGGVIQAWLAGDKNNPHYLYRSKPGRPENFSPADYIPVGSPDFPINAVINWRGAIIVGTTATWWIIVGGANPYPQPTGAEHGIVAKHGWVEVPGAIHFQAADGLREFTGADPVYKTTLLEWVFRSQPLSLIPLADLTQLQNSISAYYQNEVYTSYVSQNGGQRYRLIYNRTYDRWRYDDVAATAMLWEKDTNALLVGKQINPGQFAVVQDQVYTQDYDDGGWSGGILGKVAVNLQVQIPYMDLGKPHFPKQWNMLETDVNTNGMTMATTLLFDDSDTIPPIVLANTNTGTVRKKVQLIISGDSGNLPANGQQAYRMSILHKIPVTVAPILYQENVYAANLAEKNNSLDTYWIKFNTDRSKLVKEGYFDYTSQVDINVNLYADNNPNTYYSFILPAQMHRTVLRVRFGNVHTGTTAFTLRTWRMIMICSDLTMPFQLWAAPQISVKEIQAGHSYEVKELAS